ncbi:MAG: hypothetical protein R3B93_02060 [Bacteroidia bacterium]
MTTIKMTNIMHRIKIYFLAFMLLSLSACKGFLEEEYLSGINLPALMILLRHLKR